MKCRYFDTDPHHPRKIRTVIRQVLAEAEADLNKAVWTGAGPLHVAAVLRMRDLGRGSASLGRGPHRIGRPFLPFKVCKRIVLVRLACSWKGVPD